MRRKDREVTDPAMLRQILQSCEILRMGLTDGDLYPYIVPMNFGYEYTDEEIYLYVHCAMAGRKYSLMQKNGVCSFEMDCDHSLVLEQDTKDATMHYKSLMGKARIDFLEGSEKLRALDLLMARDERTRSFPYSHAHLPRTAVARLTVTELTGKTNPGPQPE